MDVFTEAVRARAGIRPPGWSQVSKGLDRYQLEAIMIPRRNLIAAAPLALAACRTADSAYFGKTDPPPRQRLVAVLGVEPGSLDPATSVELLEERVIYAL